MALSYSVMYSYRVKEPNDSCLQLQILPNIPQTQNVTCNTYGSYKLFDVKVFV